MIRDAGAGFENLRIVLRQNYEFLANRDVKNFKDLKKFLSKSNITPKEAFQILDQLQESVTT